MASASERDAARSGVVLYYRFWRTLCANHRRATLSSRVCSIVHVVYVCYLFIFHFYCFLNNLKLDVVVVFRQP